MHLKENFVKWGQIVGHDAVIGLLGKTGNAAKSGTHALCDSDSRAAFPAIRQGLWKRPAACEIQLAENVLSQS